ncbi:hypothetical protein G7046_g8448 [Stylonectria norvegica]|nr:hypothetical protein G7046_g8448 [Stylonectria norvegica]
MSSLRCHHTYTSILSSPHTSSLIPNNFSTSSRHTTKTTGRKQLEALSASSQQFKTTYRQASSIMSLDDRKSSDRKRKGTCNKSKSANSIPNGEWNTGSPLTFELSSPGPLFLPSTLYRISAISPHRVPDPTRVSVDAWWSAQKRRHIAEKAWRLMQKWNIDKVAAARALCSSHVLPAIENPLPFLALVHRMTLLRGVAALGGATALSTTPLFSLPMQPISKIHSHPSIGDESAASTS